MPKSFYKEGFSTHRYICHDNCYYAKNANPAKSKGKALNMLIVNKVNYYYILLDMLAKR